MSTYKQTLPRVFPYVIKMSIRDARFAVRCIMASDRDDVTQGSSFAVTVDANVGMWNLWVSSATYKFLRDNDIITNIDTNEE